MTVVVEPPLLVGRQEPTFAWIPPHASTMGVEVVEQAASAGLILDPWQQLFVSVVMAEDHRCCPVCFEVGLVLSRQNGKDAGIEACELGWLFLLDVSLTIHSAHLFDTSKEHFLRLLHLIDNHDDFRRRVKAVRKGKGDEQIELLSGQRLDFMTRKGGAGRGFTAEKLVLNEAMYLDAMMMAAVLPTLATRPGAQVIYAGSAGMRHSTQLALVRKRGYARNEPSLAYLEWAASDDDDRADPATWAKTNPGLGRRISVEYIRREMLALGGPDSPAFATERLGVGDWPIDEESWDVIPKPSWEARADPDSMIPDGSTIALALHADPERQLGTIGVCGVRGDGRRHVEVVERHRGTSWMVDAVKRMAELDAKYRPCAVAVLKTAAAASAIAALEQAGIVVVSPSETQYAQACGRFHEAFTEGDAIHLDQPSLNRAVGGARKRENVEGGWRWSLQLSTADVGPAIVGTLAMWGLDNHPVMPRSRVY